MVKMYPIFEDLLLIRTVFGTASVIQTGNKSPLCWHMLPIKERNLRESFPNDWPIVAKPLVYQVVSEQFQTTW